MEFLTQAAFRQKSLDWEKIFLNKSPGILPVDINSTALLVLDMQNEFLSVRGQMKVWGGPAIIPGVEKLMRAFRQRKRPIVFSRHICLEPYKHKDTLQSMKNVKNLDNFLRAGSFGAQIIPSIKPNKEDFVVTKYKYSAFYDTPLDTYLRVNNLSKVIITGVASNICCDSTARDAFYRGYKVYFPINGNGGLDEPTHCSTLSTMRMSFGELCTIESLINALT